MGVIRLDHKDADAFHKMLSAEMAAALFDNEGYSPTIRTATREWIAEQRKNGYREQPRPVSGSEWALIAIPFVAVFLVAFTLLN